MAQSSGAIALETVDPHFYARAKRIEDRLIKLIDGGEDLALWFHRPDLSSVVRDGKTRFCAALGGAAQKVG
jgi:hypothetical protein